MARMVHTMLRVRDLAASVDFYQRAFDLQLSDRFEAPDFILAFLRGRGSDMELELTWNRDREQDYETGDGFGHIAVTVGDLETEHARLSELALSPTPIVEMAQNDRVGARLFFVADPDGYQIEVLDRIGRFQ